MSEYRYEDTPAGKSDQEILDRKSERRALMEVARAALLYDMDEFRYEKYFDMVHAALDALPAPTRAELEAMI